MSSSRAKRRATDDGSTNYIQTPVSAITPEQHEALIAARSLLPLQLDPLAPLLETFLKAYDDTVPPHKRAIRSHPASDFKRTITVTMKLGIEYSHTSNQYSFELKDDKTSPKPMNPHYDFVVSDLGNCQAIRHREDEALSRTIIDLILIDRIQKLENENSFKQLILTAEVPISVKYWEDSTPIIAKGRADWVLGWGVNKSETGSILIAVEAKATESGAVGMAQLVAYMAGVQESRSSRPNKTVFGLLTDTIEYRFACLDNGKKLWVSAPLRWYFEKNKVLAYIDAILLDAISSSPHTTPQKTGNSSLLGYDRYLNGKWRFGTEDSDEEAEEGEEEDAVLVDVIASRGDVVMSIRPKMT